MNERIHEKTTEKDILAKEKKKYAAPTVSAVLPDGSLVEMIYRSDEKRTHLCLFKGGDWRFERYLDVNDTRLIPYAASNNLIAHKVVLLPSEPEEYGLVEELIEEIRGYIHRYVDVSPIFERIASYYVLLTWVYDSFNELPYLRLKGDYGSGKTRFLLTVGSLCYKPIFASGASTLSPIFRMLDSIRGTLIIDEGDFRFSDERSEIIKILNNGNARGFPVLRSEVSKKGEYDPQAFTIYGPKIIATRRSFEDRALESRCITEEMGGRKLRADIPINLPPEHKEGALRLRNKLLLFRFRHFKRHTVTTDLLSRNIEPRLRQVFTPLLSIINDPTIRAELIGLVQAYQGDIVADRGMSVEAQVLEVIRDLVELEEGRLSVKEITTWFQDRFGDEHFDKVTPKWMGGIIRNHLQLKTRKSHGVYIIPPEEAHKLTVLFEKYGLASNTL
ncbi:hypothetical protein MJD09_06410 [bacterium]|nr:hypothetical protein [bacterium]